MQRVEFQWIYKNEDGEPFKPSKKEIMEGKLTNGEYGTIIPMYVTCPETDVEEAAFRLLVAECTDENFAQSGYRNDAAVNCMIALYVLGMDQIPWLIEYTDKLVEANIITKRDSNLFIEHCERVDGYPESWGQPSKEYALQYTIYY